MNITERKPYSPGEILQEEFLEPLGITQPQLAEQTGVTRQRVNEIINGRRAITPDIAVRFAKAFGTTSAFWLHLQLKLDLWETLHDERKREEYDKIKRFAAQTPRDHDGFERRRRDPESQGEEPNNISIDLNTRIVLSEPEIDVIASNAWASHHHLAFKLLVTLADKQQKMSW